MLYIVRGNVWLADAYKHVISYISHLNAATYRVVGMY